MNADGCVSRYAGKFEQLKALIGVGKAVTSSLEIGEVLKRIMEQISTLLDPSDWSLLLVDPEQGDLYFEIAVGEAGEGIMGKRLAFGEGIAGWVAREQEPVMVPDVSVDPRFSNRFDEVTDYKTGNILAVPLVFQGNTLGVIELVSKAGSIAYGEEELDLLTPFADFAAIAIANARNFEKIEQLSILDECTPLYNSRYLYQALEREVARSRRYSHPLSLVFIDLDYFKGINDTHGHLAGTRLLYEVGELLLSTFRHSDMVFRYGGDEFVALLPETSRDKACNGALRFWHLLREREFLVDENLNVRLSASIGVASYPDDADDPKTLLQAADNAMYAAKTAGRDRVALAGEGPLPAADNPLSPQEKDS
jgi:diguanylate cyclase (GGDEF)-like protein